MLRYYKILITNDIALIDIRVSHKIDAFAAYLMSTLKNIFTAIVFISWKIKISNLTCKN